MTQVAPIAAAICHINAEDRRDRSKVVLVEDPLKWNANKFATLYDRLEY